MTLLEFIQRLKELADVYGDVPITFYDSKTERFGTFTSALMLDDESKEFLVFIQREYVDRFQKIKSGDH